MADEQKAEKCVGIVSAVERLDCFDTAFRALPKQKKDKAIEVCERVLLARLSTPSTYKHISSWVSVTSAHIEFDAQNNFSAVVRGVYSCLFAYDGVGFSYVNLDLKPNSVIDKRFFISPSETTMDTDEGAKTYTRVTGIKNPRRDASYVELCASAFGLPETTPGKVLDAPTGGATVYVRPVAGPFIVGQCMVLGGEVTSHNVVR